MKYYLNIICEVIILISLIAIIIISFSVWGYMCLEMRTLNLNKEQIIHLSTYKNLLCFTGSMGIWSLHAMGRHHGRKHNDP